MFLLYLFRNGIKMVNVSGLESAPPGNRPGALPTKPYVPIELRRNFYTLIYAASVSFSIYVFIVFAV